MTRSTSRISVQDETIDGFRQIAASQLIDEEFIDDLEDDLFADLLGLG